MIEEELAKTAIGECRAHFLRAAAADPEIRLGDHLLKDVYEPSQKLWAELGLPVPNRPSTEYTQEQWLASRKWNEEHWRLLKAWATHHNLDYDWVHRTARDAMAAPSFPAHVFAEVPAYKPPDHIWPIWAFEYESERDYQKRMRQTVEAYIEEVKISRRNFLSDGHAQNAHYHWAALHVCVRWTFAEIARNWSLRTKTRSGIGKDHTHTRQAIQKAVHPILERLGIHATT